MSETPARTSYEVFVGRHVSPATLATFPVALVPTSVPRNTVRRLRVGADSDIAEIVRRLTERGVQLLEIRRCPQRPRWRPRQREHSTFSPGDEAGVVIPFPRTTAGAVGAAADPGAEEVPSFSVSLLNDAGVRHARRPRRRAARG